MCLMTVSDHRVYRLLLRNLLNLTCKSKVEGRILSAMIKFIIPLVFFSFIHVSCASLFNESTQQITLSTTSPVTIVSGTDTLGINTTELEIEADRGPENLGIVLYTDTTRKDLLIEPHTSSTYWLNLFPVAYWLGFLIDNNNPKRYAYPGHIYVSMTDTSNTYTLHDLTKQFSLHVSFPSLSYFTLYHPVKGRRSLSGLFGITLGMDWYYQDNAFASISVGAVGTSWTEENREKFESYENSCARYLDVSHNYRLTRSMIGCGLSLTNRSWDFKDRNAPDSLSYFRTGVHESYLSLGLCFPLYYLLGEHLFVGVVYRPNLFHFGEGDLFRYEHVISLDGGWKQPF